MKIPYAAMFAAALSLAGAAASPAAAYCTCQAVHHHVSHRLVRHVRYRYVYRRYGPAWRTVYWRAREPVYYEDFDGPGYDAYDVGPAYGPVWFGGWEGGWGHRGWEHGHGWGRHWGRGHEDHDD